MKDAIFRTIDDGRSSNTNEISADEIQNYLKYLMFLKGEFITEKQILVIKRAILLKIFLKSKLLEKHDKHGFEIMINKEYGNHKHSFTLEDLNRIILLIGDNYFSQEFWCQPKRIMLQILELSILPYTASLLREL